jgi:hypothetical protein
MKIVILTYFGLQPLRKIAMLFVQKMGVGRALLNKVEEISSTLGLNFYNERVEKTNLIAQRLLNDYQKIDLMIYKKKFN